MESNEGNEAPEGAIPAEPKQPDNVIELHAKQKEAEVASAVEAAKANTAKAAAAEIERMNAARKDFENAKQSCRIIASLAANHPLDLNNGQVRIAAYQHLVKHFGLKDIQELLTVPSAGLPA
jgi:hypothetical protein